jgi:probable rRNA maturation factor
MRRGLLAAVMDARGRPVRLPGLGAWLSRVAPASARGSVNIAMVTDARIRALNREFRRRDTVTDVLSFPAARLRAPGPDFLGDIVIARGTARRQARLAGHSELTELRILALHGLLHLMGYDHHGPSNAMARLERRLRKKGGLGEGLIERAHKR